MTKSIKDISFSKAFRLSQSQHELDFVDIPLNTDTPLFIDPFALSQGQDALSKECHFYLKSFFDRLITDIRLGQIRHARELLSYLKEPNETHFGYSIGKSQGAGIGVRQSKDLLDALTKSAAVKSGILSSLEECELLIHGIAHDKISDLTTNVLRSRLLDYTKFQCDLHNIPTQIIPVPPCFDPVQMDWTDKYADVPIWKNRPIMLVPKFIVRYEPAYRPNEYYEKFVLKYFKAKRSANESLVGALRKPVTYDALRKEFPLCKEFLLSFSQEHPEILIDYRHHLEKEEKLGRNQFRHDENEPIIASKLIKALELIQTGDQQTEIYYKLMSAILEFVFYPMLIYPKYARPIQSRSCSGELVMMNAARAGIFAELRQHDYLQGGYLNFECRNVSVPDSDINVDNLVARFSAASGKIGVLICRKFQNLDNVIKQCKKYFNNGHGLIIPIDDGHLNKMLQEILFGFRINIAVHFNELVQGVVPF